MARKPHELELIREQLAHEIDGDAEILAKQLFGDVQPDSDTQTDAQFEQSVLAAFAADDRKWLLDAARANPEPFRKAFYKLGGVLPEMPL